MSFLKVREKSNIEDRASASSFLFNAQLLTRASHRGRLWLLGFGEYLNAKHLVSTLPLFAILPQMNSSRIRPVVNPLSCSNLHLIQHPWINIPNCCIASRNSSTSRSHFPSVERILRPFVAWRRLFALYGYRYPPHCHGRSPHRHIWHCARADALPRRSPPTFWPTYLYCLLFSSWICRSLCIDRRTSPIRLIFHRCGD